MAMDLTGRIIGAESGGNPLARNPRSSAGGLGQFINSTWLSTIRKHRPDLANRSNSELLRLKFDPSLSKAMTAAYAADNQGFLKSKGIDPTPGNTYLAHFAGPQGAAAIHANPNAPIEQLMGASAVAANPFLRGKTGADVINWASGKVGANAPASKHMAANAVNQVANGAPMATPIGGAPIAGGPVPLQPLTPPSERRSKLADALLAQAVGAKVNGWGDAVRALGGAALGYTMGEKADKQQGEYRSKLAEMLSGASNENLPATLLGSGDEDLMKAGVSLKAKQAEANAPLRGKDRFMAMPDGRIMDLQSMQPVSGIGPKEEMTPDMREYAFAMKQRQGEGQPAMPFDAWIKEVKAKQADSGYGTNLYQYKTPDGKTIAFQTSKAGGRKDLELPDGAEFLPGIDLKDIGTAYIPVDKKSGTQAGPAIPKDVAGEQAAQERGKGAGQAQLALPAAKTTVENAFKTIGELEKHPGIDTGTGLSNVLDPRSWTPGTDAYNFLVKNRKATSQSFMGAREALKGAGQVTDFEGAKGEQALAALEAAQSKDQYIEELKNLKLMMQASYDDLQRKASMAGGGAPAPAQQAPQFDLNAAKQKYGLE